MSEMLKLQFQQRSNKNKNSGYATFKINKIKNLCHFQHFKKFNCEEGKSMNFSLLLSFKSKINSSLI